MKRKILLGSFAIIMCLGLVGCDNSSDSGTTGRENHSNKLTCSNEATKYVLYFDENDTLQNFDAYETIDISEESITVSEVKEVFNKVCDGEGEFPKDWIEECELTNDGDLYTMHIYINNNKWFDDVLEKEAIKNIAETDGIESKPLNCK